MTPIDRQRRTGDGSPLDIRVDQFEHVVEPPLVLSAIHRPHYLERLERRIEGADVEDAAAQPEDNPGPAAVATQTVDLERTRGLWPAVEEFLALGTFRLEERYTNNNGLTVLEPVRPAAPPGTS